MLDGEIPSEGEPEDVSTSGAKEILGTEPEVEPRRGVVRKRSEESSGEGGLELPNLKRRRTAELLSDSEEE